MEIVRQVLAVALVFGLLGAALWAARRGGLARLGPRRRSQKSTKQLEILERLPLSPQQSLYLARLGDRALLIGTGSGAPALLESVPLHSIMGTAGNQRRENDRCSSSPLPEATSLRYWKAGAIS